MEKQKPPDPYGKLTGFPFYLLWEDFAPDGIRFGKSPALAQLFEDLCDGLRNKGEVTPRLTCARIDECLERFEISDQSRKDLARELYILGAAYLLPRVRRQCGFTPKAFRAELLKLEKQAEALLDTIKGFGALITLTRFATQERELPTEEDWADEIEQMTKVLVVLKDLSKRLAEDVPGYPRGTSVNVLRNRFISDAANLVKGAGLGSIKILQTDGAGRNYRAANNAAELLFDYIRIVDSGIVKQTVFNCLKDHGYDLRA